MTKHISFFNHKCFLVVALFLVFTFNVSALSEKKQLLVEQNLSKKLQSDLANANLTVKLKTIEEREISVKEVGLMGDAVCVLTENDTQLPIQFEVKVDRVSQNILDIKYDFVSANSEFAPTQNEEILMKELMTQLSRDYKTKNIVIAIDNFENVGAGGKNEKKFLGVGEVRIGDMVWNKIKFDVVLDAQTQKASKIIYKMEK